MLHVKRIICFALILLFLGLSFNAYACLLPVNGVPSTAMGNGCETPDEQPVSPVCDVFKTLGVQSVDKQHSNSDYQVLCPEDSASLARLVTLFSCDGRLYKHPLDGSPQDLLLRISVFRI